MEKIQWSFQVLDHKTEWFGLRNVQNLLKLVELLSINYAWLLFSYNVAFDWSVNKHLCWKMFIFVSSEP